MPIYEYECPKCGRFEVVQKIDEKPLRAKPECDCKTCPKKAIKLISAAAFHLKGGGWYKTDYASGSSGSGGKSKKSSDSSASTESKSESSKSDAGDKGDKSEKKSLKTTGGCGPGCGCH